MSDLISRQAAIDAANRADYRGLTVEDVKKVTDEVVKELKQLPSAQPEQPEQHWIPCSERLPERIINGDVEEVQEFYVTVKERWPGREWSYNTDVAEFPGDYIDDIWQTHNDWREGQEVHVIAWMHLPEPYKEKDNERT